MAVISMKGAAFLMAMDTVIGGIHIQNDAGGCALMLVKEERDEQGSQGLILARLADVVVAVIVRGWVECGCGNSSAFVTALREPKLSRAILALHRHPGRDWTVAELAAESGLSRSVFAKRFQEMIGIAPLHYAAELRMRIARTWLAYERMSIENVAYKLGYTSQAAFSRAYKRIVGVPPGYSRRALGK